MQSDKNNSVESLLYEADLSPIPSPDYDAPSPEPDDTDHQLKLPDEEAETKSGPVIPGLGGDSTPPLPTAAASAPPMENISISEYLTQLATGVRC